MPETAFIYHPHAEWHDTGRSHPETAARTRLITDYLLAAGYAHNLTLLRPQEADMAWLEWVHSPAYCRFVEEACLQGKHTLDQGETLICEDSFYVARLAAGAAIMAVDVVMDGSFKHAFSNMRPPGHHARPGAAMGFCLFNNVALAAERALRKWGAQRVAIVDWDVHHGNGTQEMFYDRADVLSISLHEDPLYPFTGKAEETGVGAGEGFTLNIPLPAGTDGPTYRAIWRQLVEPALDAYRPDLILISCGFDAHLSDPLAHLRLEAEDFGWLTERLQALAQRHCEGRLVSILEGGYDLDALEHCAAEHLRALVEA